MNDSNDAEPVKRIPIGAFRTWSGRILVCLILLVVVLVSAGLNVAAITVSVSAFHLNGVPTERVKDEFAVLNTDSSPASFEVETVDWDRAMDGVTRTFPSDTLARSCASWITLSRQTATLAPGEEVPILIDVDVPHDAQGTHWAGILVTVHSTGDPLDDGDVGLLRQFLVRVFVTTPPVARQGVVSSLQIQGINPLSVEVMFTNVGDTLLSGVSGLVVAESQAGVSLVEMRLVSFDLLPGYSIKQYVRGDWGIHIAGLYLIRAVVDFGAEYLVAGQSVLRIPDLELVPLGLSLGPPLDRDGNGLYEDVDGDGSLTLSDVDLLREFIHTSAIQRNVRAFDYNNDGVASDADVDALHGIVLRLVD